MSVSMAEAVLGGGCQHNALTVLYDESCPLCRRLKAWLAGQPTVVAVEFLPAAGTEARRRYPALDHERSLTHLTVIRADGAVYEEERAWLACAWSLLRWQRWAEHLATRRRAPLVRWAARSVDAYRRHQLQPRNGQDCDCQLTNRPRLRGRLHGHA